MSVSRLLDSGSTLKKVADVLRHRELDTSMIYAKVDMGRLRTVMPSGSETRGKSWSPLYASGAGVAARFGCLPC